MTQPLFPPFLGDRQEPSRVLHFTPDGAATFKVGALVYYDTGTQTLKECGADPALILGIALADAVPATGKSPFADGKVPVLVLQPETLVCMASTTVPAETQVLNGYGVVKDSSGFWLVDIGDTVNKRLDVARVDISNGVFYVQFYAANLQLDAIAS